MRDKGTFSTHDIQCIPKKYIKVIGQILLKVNTFKTMLNTSLVYTLVYWGTMRYRITVQNHEHSPQCEIQRCKQKYRKKDANGTLARESFHQ